MARIRYIKPQFFEDTKLATVSVHARLLYIGLWCWMDKEGVAEDQPMLIKRNIFAYEDKVTIKKVQTLIDELVNISCLTRIEYSGKRYLYCPKFADHQKFHPGEDAKYKIPKAILNASVQQPASNLLDTYKQPANNPLTGIGIGTLTGTGTGTITGTGTTVVTNTPLDQTGPIDAFLDDLTKDVLISVKQSLQNDWLKTYPNPSWVLEELKKANNWIKANPQKAPRSNYSRFLNNWLAKGWEYHRKGVPSKNKKYTVDIESILKGSA